MFHSSRASRTLAQGTFLAGKSPIEVPVLIVGAGPTGLCTSILLSRYDIPSLLVERHASTSIYPRAVGISVRTMELLRQWGLDQHVREAGLNLDCSFSPVSLTLAQPELARVPLGFPMEHEALAVSPVAPCACPQDALEPILLEHARSYSEAQVIFGTELIALKQDEEGVSATLSERMTGEGTVIRARYVVAADGARSRVRELVGIPIQGPGRLNDFLSILFRADLKRLIEGRAFGAYLIRHPEASGILLPTSTDDRWAFGTEWHPERGERLEDYDGQRCIHLVRTAAGVPNLDVKLIGMQAFTFAAQVAQRYREGNVFLAGDAAHRMTPSGGMVMNTSIHDAHNLAWKLAAVLGGWADPMLLETYESERRPVGLRNTMRSNTRRTLGRQESEAEQQTEGEAPWSDLEIDLGYSYESTAIIAEPLATNDSAASTSRIACQSGKRAPHIWLERGGRHISTIDLYDRTLTLLTGSRETTWSEAARMVATTRNVPLTVQSIGPEGNLRDVDHDWSETYGIDADGALLIRPDGFVAWRQHGTVRDQKAELQNVIDQILGPNPSCLQAGTGLHLQESETCPSHV